MKTVIVIQARLGSSRLPCKALLNLRGLPVIDWVTDRCRRSRLADAVIAAVPDTRMDDVLADHLVRRGVSVHRGPEQDVLARMIGAARALHADAVVRVCADNPLICGEEIDHLIAFYRRARCDYAYNHIPRGNRYPDGLGAEMVSFSLLEAVGEQACLPAHREHCLSYITDNPDRFSIRTFDPPDAALRHPELKLDLDTAEDFVKLSLLPVRPDMPARAVVAAACGGETARVAGASRRTLRRSDSPPQRDLMS